MKWIPVLVFFVITIAVALFSWRKTRKENLRSLSGLFFANRKLGFVAVGFGLLFANINTASFIGENELTYTNNMSVMAWGVTSVFAMLIVSEFILPVYLNAGFSTTPDYLEARYDKSVKRVVSVIFLANYIINLLPSVLYSGAVAFDGLFGFSDILKMNYWTVIWILIWIMGSIGALYSLLGGLRAITVSDTVLGLAMFTGGLLLPFFALQYLGDGNWLNGLHIILTSKTEHLNSIGNARDAIPFSTLFTGMLLVNLYYWGTEQYIVQQALGSKDLVSCQKGIAVACAGKLILPLLLNIPGVIAVHLYDRLPNTVSVFSKLAGDVSSPVYTGFWAALLFGAALTTFNAGLNSSSTLFVLNIYKPFIEKKQQQKEEDYLRVAKRFEIILCFAAMFIAPFILFAKGGLYTYLQKVGGLFSLPIFTILLLGMLTKRVSAFAAKTGLVFFIITYGITQFAVQIQLHFLHVLAILFLLTTCLILLISFFKPNNKPLELVQNSAVKLTPWKNRHFVSFLLIVSMILIYILFSPAGLAK